MRIGVDLGGTKIEILALDSQGSELLRTRVPTPSGDYEATLHAIRQLVESVESQAGKMGSIGVATPGAISPATGLLKNSNSTCLNDKPLLQDLEKCLARPIRIANDADCFALSEAVDGAAAGAASVFGVIIGTGTGGGIVVNNHLLTGPNAIAGEWGHNPMPWPREGQWPGPRCYCARRGCIETFLSGPGLSQAYARAGGEPLSAVEIAARAAAGLLRARCRSACRW